MHCRLLTQYAIIMVKFLAGLRKLRLRPGDPKVFSLYFYPCLEHTYCCMVSLKCVLCENEFIIDLNHLHSDVDWTGQLQS